MKMVDFIKVFGKKKKCAILNFKFSTKKKSMMIDPLGFAMNRFAYYECYECKSPYFGGQAQCAGGYWKILTFPRNFFKILWKNDLK